MVVIQCKVCGADIHTYPSMVDRKRYCGRKCLGEARREQMRGNTFRVGLPGNCAKVFPPGFGKWMKGRRNSPATEFKPGGRGRAPVGLTRIQRDKGTGRPRVFVKVAEPNKWRPRAQLVWIEASGPIPDGMIVHHKNRDTLDDAFENLELVTRAEHMREHRHESDVARTAGIRRAWGERKAGHLATPKIDS